MTNDRPYAEQTNTQFVTIPIAEYRKLVETQLALNMIMSSAKDSGYGAESIIIGLRNVANADGGESQG
jgi:hypothetical protein